MKKDNLLLAVENQGVWTLFLNIQTGEPWEKRKFFHFLVEGRMAVCVNPERGVVCS